MSYTVLYWVHEDRIALGDKNPLGETGGKTLLMTCHAGPSLQDLVVCEMLAPSLLT